MNDIKREIEEGRPIIYILRGNETKNGKKINIGHVAVIFGYSQKKDERRINVNFGWGPNFSNINMDMSAGKSFYKGGDNWLSLKTSGYYTLNIR